MTVDWSVGAQCLLSCVHPDKEERRLAVVTTQLFPRLPGSSRYLQPLFDIVEGLLVGHVVDDNDTVGAPVVRRGDGPESLLPGCIPDLLRGRSEQTDTSDTHLQLYRLPVKLYSSDFKVDTYCGNVGLSVCVVGKSERENSINAHITNQL